MAKGNKNSKSITIRDNEDTPGLIGGINITFKTGVLNVLLCELMNQIVVHRAEIKTAGQFKIELPILAAMLKDEKDESDEQKLQNGN